MSRRGRGSTGPGRAAALPGGDYERHGSVGQLPGGVVVFFHGDDDRRRIFEFSRLPLPGWHEALAAAFAERTGPGGGLRTAAAAGSGWGALGRLVRFLAAVPDPPARPDQLTCGQLQSFHDQRAGTAPLTALRDLAEARMLRPGPRCASRSRRRCSTTCSGACPHRARPRRRVRGHRSPGAARG